MEGRFALIERARLFNALDEPLQNGHLILWGEQGSGKTCLVQQYLDRSGSHSSCIHLTPSKGHLASFLAQLSNGSLNPVLDQNGQVDCAETATQLAIFLARTSPRYRFLMIDNIEHAFAFETLDVIRLLMQAPPPGLSLILIADGALDERLEAIAYESRCHILPSDELALSVREIQTLAQKQSMEFAAHEAQHIYDLCLGWPAAVQCYLDISRLTGVAVRNLGPIKAWLQQRWWPHFTVQQQQALKLLALPSRYDEAVLQCISDDPAVLNFALRFPAISNLVSLAPSGTATLNPLLREFLLDQHQVDELLELLVQRKSCLLQQGQFDLLVAIAQRVRDSDTLLETILVASTQWASQGLPQIMRWIEYLPSDRLAHPGIQLLMGSHLLPTDPLLAEQHFNRAYEGFLHCGDYTQAAFVWSLAIKAIMGTWHSVTKAERWVNRLALDFEQGSPQQDPIAELHLVTGAMGLAIYFLPLSHPAEHWLQRAMVLLDDLSDAENKALLCEYTYHYLCFFDRSFSKATSLAQRFHKALTTQGGNTLSTITLHFLDAQTHIRQGNLRQFSFSIAQLQRLQHKSGIRILDSYIAAGPIYLALLQQDLSDAQNQLLQMRFKADTAIPMNFSHMKLLETWYYLESNQLNEAQTSINLSLSAAEQGIAPFAHLHVLVMAALVKLAKGEWQEARQFITQSSDMNQNRRGDLFIQIQFAWALYHFLQANFEETNIILNDVLSSAQEHGLRCHLTFVRCLYDPMLRYWVNQNPSSSWEVEWCGKNEKVSLPTRLMPSAQSVEINLLGAFRLRVNGQSLVESRKQPKRVLGLLKALLLKGGQANEMDLVCELWPDLEGDKAHDALKSAVYRLRKLIGSSAIKVQGGVYSIDPEVVWCDWLSVYPHVQGRSREFTPNELLPLLEDGLLPLEEETPILRSARQLLSRYVNQPRSKTETAPSIL